MKTLPRFLRSAFALFMLVLLLPGLVSAEAMADDGLPFRIHYGDRNSPKIAITVDDCHNTDVVWDIYQLCKEYDIGLTLFPVGKYLKEEDAEMWRTLAADPKVIIGSHTQNHANWDNLSKESIQKALREFEESLDNILGYHYEVRFVRPPYGHCTKIKNRGGASVVQAVIGELGYTHAILWDVSNTDPKGAYQTTKNGSILLYHSNRKDYRCLKQLIPQLLEAGFEPVTIAELLDM